MRLLIDKHRQNYYNSDKCQIRKGVDVMKIKIVTVVRWLFAGLFILFAFVGFSEGGLGIAGGILFLAAAALVSPLSSRITVLNDRKPVAIGLSAVAFVCGAFCIPTSSQPESADSSRVVVMEESSTQETAATTASKETNQIQSETKSEPDVIDLGTVSSPDFDGEINRGVQQETEQTVTTAQSAKTTDAEKTPSTRKTAATAIMTTAAKTTAVKETTAKITTAAKKPITVKSFSDVHYPNEKVTVSITGQPNTEYTIAVHYSSKISDAQGLEPKTSDENGNVSWTWKVGPNTKSGERYLIIKGGGEEKRLTFTVGNKRS